MQNLFFKKKTRINYNLLILTSCMKIKGTAVRSITEFVKNSYSDKYAEWLDLLPSESQAVFRGGVRSSDWYDMQEVAIKPTEIVGDMFYGDVKRGAWECGRFSARNALTGIYKLYVMASRPSHIIERAGRIFAAYYQGAEMDSWQVSKKEVTVVINKFPLPNDVIECRIGGWIECALEISGCKNVDVKITQSMVKGDSKTVYSVVWS